ncbi:hypothetical protein BO99DRAFT_479328 [Aspergillus violaceofuscus CBS 115571]|uniref:Uncharacterized protein n=1 Tax=Aspergillus violaceofuscus (strain CBS 115571) TaxID=1450538 RepID=A0A2V5I3Y6_ASPV1|nr:hypothetical protein BO99DRAFT_479328 [Aspergillus violaceofuscus CBS 115571]
MDADFWFREWTSKRGQNLSNTQITRLVALTRQWKNTDISGTLSVWASDPSAEFWGFEPFHTEGAWVRRCLETKVPLFVDCDKKTEDCEKFSARRRILLIILHDIIQREVLRLRTSFQAQSVKFLTTAIRNIVGKAYPGKDIQKLCDKCTHLQRYGQRYSSLARKELVLTPLQGTSSNFERAKIENIEMEALVAFGEATYDEKHQSKIEEAFKCILNTCPFRRSGNSKPWLPSTSTRRRLRKKAARTKDLQETLPPATASRQNEAQVIQNLPSPRPKTFSPPDKLLGAGRNTTAHLIEAQNAALVQTQPSQPREEYYTRETWNNSPMPCVPIQRHSPGDNLQHGGNMLFISQNAANPFNPHQGIHPLDNDLLLSSQNAANPFDPYQGIHPLDNDLLLSSQNTANPFDPYQGIHPLDNDLLLSSQDAANPFDPYQGIHPLDNDLPFSSEHTANPFDPYQGIHPLDNNLPFSSEHTANSFDPHQGIHPLCDNMLFSSQNVANLFDPRQRVLSHEEIILFSTQSLVYPFDPTRQDPNIGEPFLGADNFSTPGS